MFSSLLSAWRRLAVIGFLFVPSAAFAADTFNVQGGEYPIAGLLRGDQIFSRAAVNASGGYLVWQDNATDGDGSGISARHLKSDLLGGLGVFRVNEQGAGDQQNPGVALRKDRGAVFVWQGGRLGAQDIYARFVVPDGTFATGDIVVNTYRNNQQANPVIAALDNDEVIIAWSSYDQDGSMQGIFAQRFAPNGTKSGSEFPVNQYSSFNQRTPAITALDGGSFVVAWVSEQRRFENSVDVYARVFGSGRGLQGNEFLLNQTTNICANPVVIASNGGFIAGWSERNIADRANGWDVYVRSFDREGRPRNGAVKVNSHLNGNHYAPQIARVGDNNLVVWTSFGQDGSREGVYGRFLSDNGAAISSEFQVNTSSASQQIYPTVASDGADRFLVVWSSFIGGPTSFELLAQRYAINVIKPAPPYVSALSSSRLSVTWPDASAAGVTGYELFVDDSAEPVTTSLNIASVGPFAPSSTHSIKLSYKLASGGRSMLSAPVSATTWGSDENLDGLPDDWQSHYWGSKISLWSDPKNDDDRDGASNLQEFLAGTDPKDSASALRMQMATTDQGNFLSWNTQPGFVYQVELKVDLSAEWTDLGAPRFAVGSTDSMLISGRNNLMYYRVKRLR
ncbi:MAG: hypothetical protein FJ403_11740 [Verrucomicrobia bacterium]|nr:hypothetical protein [Verrucomicrobiota bacterium]